MPERAEHEPDVIQIELPEKEKRGGVFRMLAQDLFRGRLSCAELVVEGLQQFRTRGACLERLRLVCRLTDGPPQLEQQRRCPQFVHRQAFIVA